MLPVVFLTPMILAAEPVRLELPDQTYDHRTQTSTFMGDPAKRLKLAFSTTTTCRFDPRWQRQICDSDQD
jgi:hypothetical protein